jgi:hypothetical protein
MIKITQEFVPDVELAIANAKQLVAQFDIRARQNVVLWLDLLGFAKQLITDRETALLRIAVFHELTLLSVYEECHVAQLNDATVISLDFSEEDDPQKLTNFLCRCDVLFEKVTHADRLVGGFGARGVLSIGHRQGLRGNFGGIALDKELTLDKIRFSSPPSIMMNMAFAKSYAVESSHRLLKEPSLYVEECLFRRFKIQVSPTWSNNGRVELDGDNFCIVRRDTE